jgi:hypothetical protein
MRITAFLLCIALIACKGGQKRPADILPPDKMGRVMKQVFAADEWIAWRNEKDPALPVFQETIPLYRGIFKKESTTEEQFRKSLRYYQDHPLEFRPILDSLVKHPGLDGPISADSTVAPGPVPVITPRRHTRP